MSRTTLTAFDRQVFSTDPGQCVINILRAVMEDQPGDRFFVDDAAYLVVGPLEVAGRLQCAESGEKDPLTFDAAFSKQIDVVEPG